MLKLTLLLACLGTSLANYKFTPRPYFPPPTPAPDVNDNSLEFHPFKSCSADGWVCEGDDPNYITLDCTQHGLSYEAGISVAVNNISESLKSLTIQNCPAVNISFNNNGDCEKTLEKLVIQDVGRVNFINSGPFDPYVWSPYNQVAATHQKNYPKQLVVRNCGDLALNVGDNGKGPGTEVLLLENVTIHVMTAAFHHLHQARLVNVSGKVTHGNYLNAQMAETGSEFVMEQCKMKTLPLRVATQRMLIKNCEIDEFGGWEYRITANESYTLEGNKLVIVRALTVMSNAISIVNNEIDAIHIGAFSGFSFANLPARDCLEERTLTVLNNTLHYVQDGALDPPQDQEYGCSYKINYDLNKFDCSCSNVNFFKSLSPEGNCKASGRQIMFAENLLNYTNTCSNFPCALKYAVSSYRSVCSNDMSSVCPQFDNKNSGPAGFSSA